MTIYSNNLNLNTSEKLKNICKNDIKDLIIYQSIYTHSDNKKNYISETYVNYINQYYEQLKNNSYPLNEILILCKINLNDINKELKLTHIVNQINYKQIYLDNLKENLFNKSYNKIPLVKIVEKININNKNKIEDYLILTELIKYLFDNNINDMLLQSLLNVFDNQQIILLIFNNIMSNDEAPIIDYIKYLKSGGYLLFEYIFDYIKNNKYDTSKFLNFINKYMKIISLETKMIYIKLNEILINIKNYINDYIENIFNENNYSKHHLNFLNKGFVNPTKLYKHTIKSYNYANTELFDIDIKKYLPITHLFDNFYTNRNKNKKIQYDIMNSTLDVRIKINNFIYTFKMALIQYIIIDDIKKNNNISAKELSEKINIPLNILSPALNSLIQQTLINYVNNQCSENITFTFNEKYFNTDNYIEIHNLFKIHNNKEYEYAHERKTIALCNIVNYAKKNNLFKLPELVEYCNNTIPFKIDEDYILTIINNNSDYIIKENEYYKYI
jgi:hypothetical protein